ncbi:hypothetical protein ACFT8Q_19750 [Streptomyces griseoincarnatus]
MVGLFITTVPVRLSVRNEETVEGLLRRFRDEQNALQVLQGGPRRAGAERGEARVQLQGGGEGRAGGAVVPGGLLDDAPVVEEGGVPVAGGRGPAGVRQGFRGTARPVQRPGEGVRRVHRPPAVPLGAGRAQRLGGVPVVRRGERGVEVHVHAAGPGQRGPGVDEGVLLAGLRAVAPVLVQLAEGDQRAGQRGAGDDLLQRRDRARAVAGRGLGARPALQGGEVGVVRGERAGVVAQGDAVPALTAFQVAQRGRHVRHVGGAGRGAEGLVQHPAGGTHVAAQLPHVRVPGEHGDARTPAVGDGGRLRGLLVPAELHQGVDPGAEGAFAVRVQLQSAVGVVQCGGEVVARGGESGLPGERPVVARTEGEGPREGAFGTGVTGGVPVGPRPLHLRGSERRPRPEVPRLLPHVGLQRPDRRVQVPPDQHIRVHRPGHPGHGTRRVPPVTPHGDGPGGHRHGQQHGARREMRSAPTAHGGGEPPQRVDAFGGGRGPRRLGGRRSFRDCRRLRGGSHL